MKSFSLLDAFFGRMIYYAKRGCGGMADTGDLKSPAHKACGFESRQPHRIPSAWNAGGVYNMPVGFTAYLYQFHTGNAGRKECRAWN